MIKDILNGNSGQIILRVTPNDSANVFEVRRALLEAEDVPGPRLTTRMHTNSRPMPAHNLASAISGTAPNPMIVQPMTISFSNPPTGGELNHVQVRFNELLEALMRA